MNGRECGTWLGWCAVVVKPSELTPATSALMAELINTHLDQDLYRLVNGAIPETTKVRLPDLVICWHLTHILLSYWSFRGIIVSRCRGRYPCNLYIECIA